MRRARRWAWVLRGSTDLPPRDRILMGFQAGLPAKRLRIPKVIGRARSQGRCPVGAFAGSLGSSPLEVVIRGIPSACEPLLRSALGSLQVLAPSNQGLHPLRRCYPLHVRCELVPQFFFFSMVFSFLPWFRRALSCSVLLLMRRLHMFVLRVFVTCEDFRLKLAPAIIFDVLKDFTSDSSLLGCAVAPIHITRTSVGQAGSLAGLARAGYSR